MNISEKIKSETGLELQRIEKHVNAVLAGDAVLGEFHIDAEKKEVHFIPENSISFDSRDLKNIDKAAKMMVDNLYSGIKKDDIKVNELPEKERPFRVVDHHGNLRGKFYFETDLVQYLLHVHNRFLMTGKPNDGYDLWKCTDIYGTLKHEL